MLPLFDPFVLGSSYKRSRICMALLMVVLVGRLSSWFSRCSARLALVEAVSVSVIEPSWAWMISISEEWAYTEESERVGELMLSKPNLEGDKCSCLIPTPEPAPTNFCTYLPDLIEIYHRNVKSLSKHALIMRLLLSVRLCRIGLFTAVTPSPNGLLFIHSSLYDIDSI